MMITNHSSLRLSAAVLALAIVPVLFACTRTDQKSAGPTEKITIAYSAATEAVLAEVAQQQGYYLQEGLEATPLLRSFGKAALKEVLDGKADFATVAEPPVVFTIMNGEKIAVVATIQTTTNGNAIIARKDKGILTPKDLKGRKIGVTPGTTGDFFMDSFLAMHGISKKDVKVISLSPNELSTALVNGDVDAVSAFTLYLIQLEKKLGEKGITFYDKDLYTFSFNIVATQEFIRNNPGKVKKLLQSLIKAEKFVKQNPDEAQRIIADYSRLDMAVVRGLWTDTTHRVSLDQSLVFSLEDVSRWAINSGLTDSKKVPNYLDFIYFDGLRSVKPEAVRILR
ncbi:MAG: NrtA/SsuA/CpmA family ABC transporter substrate-binding protein [Thermodesulfovibrionales bacterium]